MEPTVVRNVAPRGRVHNAVSGRVNREQFEKARLKQRAEGFVRHGQEIDRPFEMATDSDAFISESERFDTDAAAEMKRYRELEAKRKHDILNIKREQLVGREESRKRQTEQDFLDEQRHAQNIQGQPKSKRNLTSVPYNPITLEYNDSTDGVRLKHMHESVMYRAAVRKHKLQQRSNGNGFNPITGEQMSVCEIPDRPVTPQVLKQQQQQMIQQQQQQQMHNTRSSGRIARH